MLYIKYIKLEEFAQLKGRVYEQHYEPHMIYAFMGANGSGKSSIVAEHDPKPTVHGFTTITKDKEGCKTIIYGDTENRSYGLKVVHFYLPVKQKKEEEEKNTPPRHSVKSFLYVLNNDEIVDTVVNGSTNEFRDKMKKYFDVDYDSIKITGIGMKYGKSMFNLLGCNDTDRYNYIKNILSNLEEVKKMENHITTSLQINNRRIKDLKSILGDISNVDFNTEMEKIKLDLKDYEVVNDNLVRDRMRLDNEYEKINAISPTKRNEITQEFQEVSSAYDVIKYYPDVVSTYKAFKEEYNFILAQIKLLNEEHAKLVASRMSIQVSDNLLNKTEQLRQLNEEIAKFEEYRGDYEYEDLERLNEAISILDSMNNNQHIITSSGLIIEDYYKFITNGDKYNELEAISKKISELDNRVLMLKDEKKELSEMFVSQHEKDLYNIEIEKVDKCNTCPLYSLKENIDNRMRTIENNMKRVTNIDIELEDTIVAISRLRIIYNNYVLFYDFLDGFKSNNIWLSKEFSNNTLMQNIHNFENVIEKIKNTKNKAMRAYRLKVLESRKLELESQEDVLSKIRQIEEETNNIMLKLTELHDKRKNIESNDLFKMREEILYKYANVDLNEKLKDLTKQITDISAMNETSQKLQSELYILENKFSELKDMQKRKQEELTKLLLEKARFDETSSSYKFELEDNRKLSILKTSLTKKIPTVLLKTYMIYVRNEANEILSDVDRYSVLTPYINYENNRNEFDIPIMDYGEVKSCALLSKGEENLISLAIVLPLIYMSTKYRVLRLDELDSTLDPFLKQKFMEKVINLKPDKIVQIFMVTHNTTYTEHERVKIINIATRA